jgi:uncharacterized damage-inducible protein DinB
MSNIIKSIKVDFIEQAILRMDEYLVKIEKCLDELEEKDIWLYPNESSNSIGNQILHLCGNITQYIIAGLGNEKDLRDRDREFNTRGGISKPELYDKLFRVVEEAKEVIINLDQDAFRKIRSVQGFELSGIGIVLHVVEHFSYHTGQIVMWTKMIRNIDLGFYSDLNLNQKNLPE